MVSIFIENKANVNLKYKNKPSYALLLAVRNGDKNIVELLISSGADVNVQTKSGDSALHIACRYRKIKLIRLLIQKGANINAQRQNGVTPLFDLISNVSDTPDVRRTVRCIICMIKEIAKMKFLNEFAVLQKDIDLINFKQSYRTHFEKFNSELDKMTVTKFYASYTYGFILKNSKNVKKLANLAKSKEFVSSFEANLQLFTYYKNELKNIFDEAITLRDQLVIVESRLKIAFGDFLPGVILRKLSGNLCVKDLPLDPADDVDSSTSILSNNF